MKTISMITLLSGCAIMLLAGCEIKDPIYNTTHPDKGAVILSADWSARSEEVGIPSEYTVELNGRSTLLTTNPAALPGLFVPGTAKLCAWNLAPGFIVADGKATLAKVDATEEEVFTSQPGWLFTGNADVNIVVDDTLRVTLPMRQRVRLLRFDLTVTEGEYDRITGIEATLSGIAPTIDLRAGGLTDATGTVAILLTRSGNKITGEARLPGISGTKQEFVVTLSFEDDEPQPRTTSSDLTLQLTGFNDDLLSPLTLTGNLRSPIRTDVGSTVIDWVSGNGTGGENGSAEM